MTNTRYKFGGYAAQIGGIGTIPHEKGFASRHEKAHGGCDG